AHARRGYGVLLTPDHCSLIPASPRPPWFRPGRRGSPCASPAARPHSARSQSPAGRQKGRPHPQARLVACPRLCRKSTQDIQFASKEILQCSAMPLAASELPLAAPRSVIPTGTPRNLASHIGTHTSARPPSSHPASPWSVLAATPSAQSPREPVLHGAARETRGTPAAEYSPRHAPPVPAPRGSQCGHIPRAKKGTAPPDDPKECSRLPWPGSGFPAWSAPPPPEAPTLHAPRPRAVRGDNLAGHRHSCHKQCAQSPVRRQAPSCPRRVPFCNENSDRHRCAGIRACPVLPSE